jgi:hypothetical protein
MLNFVDLSPTSPTTAVEVYKRKSPCSVKHAEAKSPPIILLVSCDKKLEKKKKNKESSVCCCLLFYNAYFDADPDALMLWKNS